VAYLQPCCALASAASRQKRISSSQPALASDPIVLDNDPSSLINLVLNGSKPLVAKGTPDPYRLPQFRLQYSDQEIADVITFIRNGWGNQAPTVTAAQVTELRNRLFDHLVGAPQKCGRKV
jgi:hypothetical protein